MLPWRFGHHPSRLADPSQLAPQRHSAMQKLILLKVEHAHLPYAFYVEGLADGDSDGDRGARNEKTLVYHSHKLPTGYLVFFLR
jgi:hypothetical protein